MTSEEASSGSLVVADLAQPGADMPLSIAARSLGSRGSRSDLADADPAAELTDDAAAVLNAIPQWWASKASQAGLTGQWLDVRQAIDTSPPLTLSDDAPVAALPADCTGQQLGAAYVEALSAGTRARHGRHYTPSVLSDRLWMMARSELELGPRKRTLPGLVRDPACGAASLLLPPLREHLRASHEQQIDPQIVLAGLSSLIEGIDTDPAAVWVANVVMASEMLSTWHRVPDARRRPLPALARVGDGLAVHDSPAHTVLVNPPYGRVKLSDEDRERFAPVLYGHANLYGIFMGAALENLTETGLLAALVPTSFTSGRYFTNLRDRLSQTAAMSSVTFVEDRSGVFSSVLQETCLAVFSKRRRQKTDVSSIGSQVTSIAKVKAHRTSRPWILPRRADDAPTAAAAAQMPQTLSSVGWRASTGPLVWNRRKKDLYSESADGRVFVVWGADIDGGAFHRDAARDSMRYLEVKDAKDSAVMRLEEPAVLVQRTTAPEQTRRLVAAALTSKSLRSVGGAVAVENHVNVLRLTADDSPIDLDLLDRLLSTKTMDQVVRCISGSVALSAYELESLPLPASDVLRQWAELAGNDLEQAVAKAYRLVTVS